MPFEDPKPGDILEHTCRKCGTKTKMTVGEFVALDEDGKKHCLNCQCKPGSTIKRGV